MDRDPFYKFYEPKNLGIFTTKQVMEENLPILYVAHEDNGDWQFLCGTTNDNADLMLVCIEDIVKKDPTLNILFDLSYGMCAERGSIKDKWQRLPMEE